MQDDDDEIAPHRYCVADLEVLSGAGPEAVYRVTQHLDSYILFPRLVGRYCSCLLPTQDLSTFNLMSTEYTCM